MSSVVQVLVPSRGSRILCFVAILTFCVATANIAAAPTEREKRVDAAIVRALEFLAREQRDSHAWVADSIGESTAATSLSIMAFLAAGHVPGEGQYGERINNGITWVLDHQEPNGMIVHKRSHGPFYSHGISTLMLAEVVGMLDNEADAARCRKSLERGVRLILDAQNVPKSARHTGGWRYLPSSPDSDLSVTGWQLLALRAARNVGCDVPADAIDRAVAFVKRCNDEASGGFCYQPGGGPTPTRTGTGILALEICGEHHTPEALRGSEFLQDNELRIEDPYFYYGAYYCHVGLFQIGGDHWDKWRDDFTDKLLEYQQPDGSWLANLGSERSAGKVYCTTMAVLALAVEYQYLPIYQR